MSKRKLFWLACTALPVTLFEGCINWSNIHDLWIHLNELTQFWAALDQLGTV